MINPRFIIRVFRPTLARVRIADYDPEAIATWNRANGIRPWDWLFYGKARRWRLGLGKYVARPK